MSHLSIPQLRGQLEASSLWSTRREQRKRKCVLALIASIDWREGGRGRITMRQLSRRMGLQGSLSATAHRAKRELVADGVLMWQPGYVDAGGRRVPSSFWIIFPMLTALLAAAVVTDKQSDLDDSIITRERVTRQRVRLARRRGRQVGADALPVNRLGRNTRECRNLSREPAGIDRIGDVMGSTLARIATTRPPDRQGVTTTHLDVKNSYDDDRTLDLAAAKALRDAELTAARARRQT